MLFLPLKKFEDTVQIFMGSGELKNLVEIFRNETVTQEKKNKPKSPPKNIFSFQLFYTGKNCIYICNYPQIYAEKDNNNSLRDSDLN